MNIGSGLAGRRLAVMREDLRNRSRQYERAEHVNAGALATTTLTFEDGTNVRSVFVFGLNPVNDDDEYWVP